MNSERNARLEEYKILKEETKIFTNQSFRDFQLFIGLITIFFAIVNAKDSTLPKFYTYGFMQLAVFVFLIIQFNRGIYLLIVRNYLAQLERRMKEDSNEPLIFEWESEIVPTQIAPRFSYSTISQLAIGLVYIIIFCVLCWKSIQYSRGKEDLIFANWFYYWVILPIEGAFIVYSAIRLVIQRKRTSRDTDLAVVLTTTAD